jgi:hypothetical protein
MENLEKLLVDKKEACIVLGGICERTLNKLVASSSPRRSGAAACSVRRCSRPSPGAAPRRNTRGPAMRAIKLSQRHYERQA